jgi:hypothetical protein
MESHAPQMPMLATRVPSCGGHGRSFAGRGEGGAWGGSRPSTRASLRSSYRTSTSSPVRTPPPIAFESEQLRSSLSPTLQHTNKTIWLPHLPERSRWTPSTTTTTFLPSPQPLRAAILAIPRPSKMPRSSSCEAPSRLLATPRTSTH